MKTVSTADAVCSGFLVAFILAQLNPVVNIKTAFSLQNVNIFKITFHTSGKSKTVPSIEKIRKNSSILCKYVL